MKRVKSEWEKLKIGWEWWSKGWVGLAGESGFLVVLVLAMGVFTLSGQLLAAGQRGMKVHVDNILSNGGEERAEPVNISDVGAPEISAEAAVVFDMDSGKWLWEKNSRVPKLPASTTKIMTALVVLGAVDEGKLTLGQQVVVPEIATKADGQKVGFLAGEPVTVENLLYALLLSSGNDAAETLAAVYPGGRSAMVTAMNEKGEELGLERTNFTNPSGFDEYLHFTTAVDLTKIAVAALEDERMAEMVSTVKASFISLDGKFPHNVDNLNTLLSEVPGVKGVKTGWTEVAGENLVTAVERGGHEEIIIVLKSKDRFEDSRKLIDWVFGNFSWPEGNL